MNRHAQLIKLGLETNPILATQLINHYASSPTPNSLTHAHQLFDQITTKDTILWTSLISAYTHSNFPLKALKLFSLMLSQRHPNQLPNHFVFATIATAIASSPDHLPLGQTIHASVIKSGFMPNNVVAGTAFLNMYSKCGDMLCARKLFDEMPIRNLVTWNAIIAGYVHNGMEIGGLELFFRMKCKEFYVPDEFSVATVLSGCAWVQNLLLGMQVHGYVIVSGLEANCVNSIANMYFHCGEVVCAERVLNGIKGDVVSGLVKIRGYILNQRYNVALKCIALECDIFEILHSDDTIIVPILTACAKLSLLKIGKQVHSYLITSTNVSRNVHWLEEDGAIIGNALIDMYSKCGSVSVARKVFDSRFPTLHITHWNSMLWGYIHNGLIEDARTLFENMPVKNVVSWTTMISGYVHTGMPQEGLGLLCKMYSNEGFGVDGNCLTFVVGLEACSYLTDAGRGKQIHSKLIRTLISADTTNVIVGTALVDTYCKSGCLNYAQRVFDLMRERNVVAWTSIIMGYAIHGFGFRALEIFKNMTEMGFEPNKVTFVAALTACSHCGLVDEGLQNYKLMREKYRLIPSEYHYTCLIDMLGRVGRLEEAWGLMEEIEDKDTDGACSSGTIWAAMLGACRLHGNVEMGRMVARKMLENKKHVSKTYITLSNVYSESGMWNEAYRVRESWRKEGEVDEEPGLSRICTSPGVS
ncbi:hypothetical protein LguiA_011704 [Lonicera macranthoides]